MSYSSEALKKAAFIDEINNVLSIDSHRKEIGEETADVVLQYLKTRVEEIDREHR